MKKKTNNEKLTKQVFVYEEAKNVFVFLPMRWKDIYITSYKKEDIKWLKRKSKGLNPWGKEKI